MSEDYRQPEALQAVPNETLPSGQLPPVRSEPLFSLTLRRFKSVLVRHGIVHECAIDDPEGWDGGKTLDAVNLAYDEIVENGAAHGRAVARTVQPLVGSLDSGKA